MTQPHGSPGPLDWTATEERLARIRPKLEDVRQETGEAVFGHVLASLDDGSLDAELRRDQVSTRLMEAFRLHQSKAAFDSNPRPASAACERSRSGPASMTFFHRPSRRRARRIFASRRSLRPITLW